MSSGHCETPTMILPLGKFTRCGAGSWLSIGFKVAAAGDGHFFGIDTLPDWNARRDDVVYGDRRA
jgi:hypothetical protein